MEGQGISVLFFLNRFPLPSETFVVDQICGLIDRGFDISIISVSKGDYDNLHEKVLKYKLDRKTTYLVDNSKNKFIDRLSTLSFSLLSPNVFKLLNVYKYGSVSNQAISNKDCVYS